CSFFTLPFYTSLKRGVWLNRWYFRIKNKRPVVKYKLSKYRGQNKRSCHKNKSQSCLPDFCPSRLHFLWILSRAQKRVSRQYQIKKSINPAADNNKFNRQIQKLSNSPLADIPKLRNLPRGLYCSKLC